MNYNSATIKDHDFQTKKIICHNIQISFVFDCIEFQISKFLSPYKLVKTKQFRYVSKNISA